MPLRAPILDYAAARRALVGLIAYATGLPRGRIVRAQAQGPVQAVPKRPYATFAYRIASMRAPFRDCEVAAPQVSETATYLRGNRGMGIDVTFFAEDQDEAYGLAGNLQSALFEHDGLKILGEAGFAVWQIGDVLDVTALLNSGYEGRCVLDFQMWTSTHTLVDPGPIDGVTISGAITSGLVLE